MAYIETSTTRPAASATFNPFKWLLQLDADYREADKLKTATNGQLRDMGLTRKQANTAFYGRFGTRR